MKKFIAIVMSLVLIASVAMLAGCGKKDDVKAAKVIGIDLTNENYAFGVDKAQPELLEKTNAFIDKILSNGTFDEICSRYSSGGEPVLVKSAAKDSSKDQLVVATNAAFEPFEYTVGDSYAGIDMEIAKLLADELGKELVIDNMDFDAVCLSVGQHKCDIAMAGLTVNPDREASVTFSKTYYKASQRVVVKGDDTTFDPQEISNNGEVARRLGVIAMNTALEMDIYGHVNSTHVSGTKLMNGIGGSGDFARNGFLSCFFCHSTAKGGKISAVVPMCSHIDHTEHDTHVFISEQGVADVRGLSPKERAKVIINNVAHPSFRDQLMDYYERACAACGESQTPHLLQEAFKFHESLAETGDMHFKK